MRCPLRKKRSRVSYRCDLTDLYVWRVSFICVTWHIQICGVVHLYVWFNLFICITCLIHVCETIHTHVLRDAFTCALKCMHMCTMSNLCVWHDAYTTHGGDLTLNNKDCQTFQQVFTGVPVHIKHDSTGVPKLSCKFSWVCTQSSSLKNSIRKTDRSREIQIFWI